MNNYSTKISSKPLSINFRQQEIPIFKEVWSNTYRYFLAGEQNKWFQDLLDLYYGSAIHAAIINTLKQKITKGFESDDIYGKITLDYLIFGGFAIEVIWNVSHTSIVKINHLDFSKVRSGKPDDQDKVLFYYYSNDWLKYSNREIQTLQGYNENTQFDDHQIYYYKRYNPGEDVYPKPYYFSSLKWIVTDIELENYYANLVANNFVANTLISVNSYYDEDKQMEFEKALKRNFTGSDNAGKMLVMYSEDKEHAPTLEKFNNDQDDTRYKFISEQITGNISVGHQLPVQLLGILVPGKLGNSTEIPTFEAIYDETVVKPTRREIITGIQPIYEKMLSKTIIPTLEIPVKQTLPIPITEKIIPAV